MNANQIHAKSSAFGYDSLLYIVFILKVFSRSHMFAHACVLFFSFFCFRILSSFECFLISIFVLLRRMGGLAPVSDVLEIPGHKKTSTNTRACDTPVSRLVKIHFISFRSLYARPHLDFEFDSNEGRRRRGNGTKNEYYFDVGISIEARTRDERGEMARVERTFLNKKRRRKDDSMQKKIDGTKK